MNKKQLIVAWTMCFVIFASIFYAMQLNYYYSHGYRGTDRYGNIVRVIRVGRKNVWNEVLKKPLINMVGALSIGGFLIYILRDKEK